MVFVNAILSECSLEPFERDEKVLPAFKNVRPRFIAPYNVRLKLSSGAGDAARGKPPQCDYNSVDHEYLRYCANLTCCILPHRKNSYHGALKMELNVCQVATLLKT